MNARQKAKKYKKELEFIKNMPYQTVEVIQPTKTYKVAQEVWTDDLNRMSEEPESVFTYIHRANANELAKNIINDIKFKAEPSIRHGFTKITGEITIVTRRE